MMHKNCTCCIGVLALLILVFSFLSLGISKWVIIISAMIILLMEIFYLVKHGCDCHGDSCGKTGEEIFVEKGKKSGLPDKEELKKIMKSNPVQKKVVKVVK